MPSAFTRSSASRSLAFLSASIALPSAAAAQSEWQSDWAVASGLTLEIDTEGFQMPTTLAFVEHPGEGPKDVLYFVTELRGTVKAITNDRTVLVFARDFMSLIPAAELPHEAGEVGVAGLCLAPDQGYVFVTFAYQDPDMVLRNGIIRFETGGPAFATEPIGAKRIAPILSADASAVSHQIGPCQVADGTLYVSVGDGQRPDLSQNLDSTLGKVLRMDLDGNPIASNPFFTRGDSPDARSYIWAYGFRNPFSLSLVGERLFAADNGVNVDRFLEVERGENYLWDGTDLSIGSRGAVFLSPAVGPVQMDYYTGEYADLPESLDGQFLIATSGVPENKGPETIPGAKGVIAVAYDLGLNRATRPPQMLLAYEGEGYQSVVGLAVGPDGIYLTPLFPNAAGRTPVLKLMRAVSRDWPLVIGETRRSPLGFWALGCASCHSRSVDGPPGRAPLLQTDSLRARLAKRLFSEAYLQRLAALDSLKTEPYESSRDNRDAIREASGEERLRRWVYYQILDPRFDDRNTAMPTLGVSETQAARLRDYLLGDAPPADETAGVKAEPKDLGLVHGLLSKLRELGILPEPIRTRHLPIAFVLGIVVGVFGLRVQRFFSDR